VATGHQTRDDRLHAILADYLDAVESGRSADRDALLAAHPDLADGLAAFFAGQDGMARLAAPLRALAPGAGDPAPGIIGDFRLLRELGRGGMGVVYEAEQLALNRRVALKVLPFAGALDGRQLQRFRHEAQAAAQLHHPHIVPVYFVGCDRGVHYYAMQLIDGRTLADVIAELRGPGPPTGPPAPGGARAEPGPWGEAAPGGARNTTAPSPATPRPPGARGAHADTAPGAAAATQRSRADRAYVRTVARWGVQAAEALDHAHEQGVVHRDVKPANLLIDAKGHLWVTDFGLAHCQTEASLTLSGDLVGTLRYMSPEQALGKRLPVDHRTDVFSLGATLYELLTLRPAFDGRDRAEILRQIACDDPRPPRRWDRAIPAELETIVLKALEKAPDGRYATAQELADDLRRWLEDKPIRARRPSLRQRLDKWVRRHSAAVVPAAAVLLLGTGVSTWQAVRATSAATAERQANETAQKRLAQIEKANDILGAIFRDLDPEAEEKGGKPLRALLGERLDRAAQELQGEAIGDPLAVAKLQTMLGESLRGLGYAEKAIALLTGARATFAAKLGPDHTHTLVSMNNLALAYQAAGKLELALPLQEEMLTLATARLGPDHPDTLAGMNNLALAYRQAGKLDRALPLYEEALKLQKAALGPDHPDTLRSMSNLAAGYEKAGRLDRALPLHEEALRRTKAKRGPDHPETLASMNALAVSYHASGQLDRALPLYEEVLPLRKAKLGPDHPQTLISMNNLADGYDDAGKPDLALPLHEETVRRMTATLGPDHPDTLQFVSNLATGYKKAGKLDLALPLYEETLRRMRVQLGPDHPGTINTLHHLAVAYQRAGKLDLALPLYEEALPLGKAKLGPEHPETLDTMNNLAAAYQQAGKLDLALPLHEETLKLSRARLGPDHPDTLCSMHNLATAYRDAGKLDRALPLHKEALELAKAKLGLEHLHTLTITVGLAGSYWSAGKLDRSVPLFEKVLKLRTATLGPDHPDTLLAQAKLGVNYRDAGRLPDAIPLLEDALDRARKRPAPFPVQLTWVPGALAETYDRAGRFAKADPLYRQAVADAKKQFGADDRKTASPLAALGRHLLLARRPVEAEAVLRDCLAIRETKEPDAWTTFLTQSLLGGALLGQQKYAEAEPLLRDGYEGMKQRETKIWPIEKKPLADAAERLADLYDATGRADEARAWRAKLPPPPPNPNP
jgi:serine/threonine protein kinase/lipopolysaccharide biosynthesis regulator YciM